LRKHRVWQLNPQCKQPVVQSSLVWPHSVRNRQCAVLGV
jgi:hypothetical protein